MRVKLKGFELGKAYWILLSKKDKRVDLHIHFTKSNRVYMDYYIENEGYNELEVSKRFFKQFLKEMKIISKEEIPLSEMYPPIEHDVYEDDDWWIHDYTCENGCCMCCGCSCYDDDDMYNEYYLDDETE